MARKRVAVFTADGTPQGHITHPEAFSKVREQTAEWIGTNFKTIRLFDAKVMPKGISDFFSMHYAIKPSAGYLVVQFTG